MNKIIKLSSPETREFWRIPVLFEDDYLLALDKPSGLLISPDRYDPNRPNLMKLLHRDIARRAAWARERKLEYLVNAHRLDLETSGVILLAKIKPVLVHLANQFGCEKPAKTYVALVHGTPAKPDFEVDLKLGFHPFKVGLVRVAQIRGKKSQTHFELIERFSGFTLLKCQPATARTHQIRVHLQSSRLPVVGDRLYGGQRLLLSTLKPGYRPKANEKERPLLDRVALHAAALQLEHPVKGELVRIESPLPKDLVVALKYLRRFAAAAA